MQKILDSKEENNHLTDKIDDLMKQVKSLDEKIQIQETLLLNQEKLLTEKKECDSTSSSVVSEKSREPIKDLFPDEVQSIWINIGPHRTPIIPPDGFGLILVEPNIGIYKEVKSFTNLPVRDF